MSDKNNWPLIRAVLSSLAVQFLYQLSAMVIKLLSRQMIMVAFRVSSRVVTPGPNADV